MIGEGEDWVEDQINALKKNNYSGYYVIEPHFGPQNSLVLTTIEVF